MRRVVLRTLALLFAVSVLTGLVVHASLTSGCSKPDPVGKEPQALPANAPASETVAAALSAPPPSPSDSSAKTAPSAPNGGSKPSNAGGDSNAPRYMPATKAGGVFRPSDLGQGTLTPLPAQQPAPQQAQQRPSPKPQAPTQAPPQPSPQQNAAP